MMCGDEYSYITGIARVDDLMDGWWEDTYSYLPR